ncbi:hypothetical protein [Anabaena cylindrica]|uniref:hypothetical protein n=1 Tax=Anabaena cylindrica TaxID=1165 RepID=UPI002B20344F|nr:hypothetical protein [Anabaena cylindrica]
MEIVFGTANLQTEEEKIIRLVEEWESWNLELVSLATLLSQFLDNQQNQNNVDVYNILEKIYTLSDERGLFSVEEIDERFIEYMLQDFRRDNLSIEDDLVEIRRNLGERKY